MFYILHETVVNIAVQTLSHFAAAQEGRQRETSVKYVVSLTLCTLNCSLAQIWWLMKAISGVSRGAPPLCLSQEFIDQLGRYHQALYQEILGNPMFGHGNLVI